MYLIVIFVVIFVALLEYYISPQMAVSIYSVSVCEDKKWTDASENDRCLLALTVANTLIFTGLMAGALFVLMRLKYVNVRSTRDMFIAVSTLSVIYPLAGLISQWRHLMPLSTSDSNVTIGASSILSIIFATFLFERGYIRDIANPNILHVRDV